eukprot:c53904_g1_i1.p1 GENE.c53904_g1_i1~~c53904_g1_i1.p1  ORF type:complete len:260 (+),score=44.52 c53904_g1_i1:26-805(+)
MLARSCSRRGLTCALTQTRWIAKPRPFYTEGPNFELLAAQWRYTGADRHIKKLCQDRHIFRDFLDKFSPVADLRVLFGNELAVCGSALTPAQTVQKPSIRFVADPSALYTLVAVDLDFPSHHKPSEREFVLWVVTNISNCDIDTGKTWFEYVGPCPAKNTGSHRIAIVLAEQQQEVPDHPVVSSGVYQERRGFNTQTFLKNSLSIPVAINLFQARYDAAVPNIYESMGTEMPNYLDPTVLHIQPRVHGKRQSPYINKNL